MLKRLHIQNIILIEKETLAFQEGLNVLTGETGCGKSAITKALMLIIGEKADSGMIRYGHEKAIVEAVFESPLFAAELSLLLNEAGIEIEDDQLIIRREISSNGKGRIHINHQVAQLSLLKKVGTFLVRMVGQHASRQLLSLDYHRQVVDSYGELKPLLTAFKTSFENEKSLRKTIEENGQLEAQRLRDIDRCRAELEELEEAALKENEEETLFSEYTLLSNCEELSLKLSEMIKNFSGEKTSILSLLNRQKQLLDSILKYDSSLNPVALSLSSALLELQDISDTLRAQSNRLEADPLRLIEINDRLTLLNRLKKKYGSDVPAMIDYIRQVKEKLQGLENSEAEIEKLQQTLFKIEKETEELSLKLTAAREKIASQIASTLSLELQSLNMHKAFVRIALQPQERNAFGNERIEFFVTPNIGEPEISLKEHASGGEIARILLALEILLLGKEEPLLLIFDEIDASIGGETAAIVGEKLQKIGTQCQVISITHFPQVAAKASHHLKISKSERGGRTFSHIEAIDRPSLQKKELERMVGKENS